MKKLIIYLSFFSALLFLVSCNKVDNENKTESKQEKNGKITLNFWSFWGSGLRREVIEEIINEFNSTQDKITVKYTYQPWGDIWTKSLSSIAGGNPPDVILQDINSVAQRAEAKQATSLGNYISEETKKEFYPQLWDTVLFEGDPYALPFNTDTQVIFYNKKIFKEAGINEGSLPQTWEQLEKIAHKLDKKNGKEFSRIGFYPLWNLGIDVWALNADNGVSWFNTEDEVKINTKNKIEALEWIMKWQDYYGESTINKLEAEFGSGVSDPFISGIVAMRAQNINYYSNLIENAPDDFDFGVIPLPEKTTGSGHWSWGGGFVLEIPYGAKHPDASYEFMDYLTSKSVQEKFGEKSFDIMANKEANESLIHNSSLSKNSQMIYKMADDNFKNTVITPVPLLAPDYDSLVKEQLDQVKMGNISPGEALSNAQKSVERLVEENK